MSKHHIRHRVKRRYTQMGLFGPTLLGLMFGALVFLLVFLLISVLPGQIDLTVTPSTATVKIDGQALSDDHVRLSSGSHTLRAEAAGYLSKEVKLSIAGGRTTRVNLALSEQPKPLLLLNSQPRGQAISPDGNWLLYLDSTGQTIRHLSLFADQAGNRPNETLVSGLAPTDQAFFDTVGNRVFLKRGGHFFSLDLTRTDLLHAKETPFAPTVQGLALSPDHAKTALLNWRADNQLEIQINNTANILQGTAAAHHLAFLPGARYLVYLDSRGLWRLDSLNGATQFLYKSAGLRSLLVSPKGPVAVDEETAGGPLIHFINANSGKPMGGVTEGRLNDSVFAESGWLLTAAPNKPEIVASKPDLGKKRMRYQASANHHPFNLLLTPANNRLIYQAEGGVYSLPLAWED